jgi:diguanylate cyclase (GGDEF)-like protein/PAS domain S-box-containing protein
MILGGDRVVRYASPAAMDLFGWRGVNLVGRRLGDLFPAEHDSGVHEQVDRAMVVAATPPADWRVRRPDEVWAHVECRITNLIDDPAVHGLVLHLRDVADRRAHETALVRQAFHDTLTGLPNRTLFLDRLTHSLKLGTRRFSRIAVLFGDLDRFKQVNDEFGHAQGDLLLRAAADRMTRCVRESDTVARFGGDEFGVLLEDLASSSDAQATASRLVRAFDAPFSIGGREYRVGLSLGVALEAAGDTVDSLLHDADVAMYAAKRRGGSRWVLYETELEAQKDEAPATTRRERKAE